MPLPQLNHSDNLLFQYLSPRVNSKTKVQMINITLGFSVRNIFWKEPHSVQKLEPCAMSGNRTEAAFVFYCIRQTHGSCTDWAAYEVDFKLLTLSLEEPLSTNQICKITRCILDNIQDKELNMGKLKS